jgi:hypothetical protein
VRSPCGQHDISICFCIKAWAGFSCCLAPFYWHYLHTHAAFSTSRHAGVCTAKQVHVCACVLVACACLGMVCVHRLMCVYAHGVCACAYVRVCACMVCVHAWWQGRQAEQQQVNLRWICRMV